MIYKNKLKKEFKDVLSNINVNNLNVNNFTFCGFNNRNLIICDPINNSYEFTFFDGYNLYKKKRIEFLNFFSDINNLNDKIFNNRFIRRPYAEVSKEDIKFLTKLRSINIYLDNNFNFIDKLNKIRTQVTFKDIDTDKDMFKVKLRVKVNFNLNIFKTILVGHSYNFSEKNRSMIKNLFLLKSTIM